MNLLWLDVETTGLDAEVHEVIEVGAILTDPHGNPLHRDLDARIRPHRIDLATAEALAINGYSAELWAGARLPDEVARLLLDLSSDAILAGWNVYFDAGFVKELLRRLGLRPNWGYHLLDVFSLAFPVLSGGPLKLSRACEVLGVPREPYPHRAINGARTALRVYRALLERAR